MLETVLGDGRINEKEIRALEGWLDRASAQSVLPGINFLKDEVEGILADGEVSEPERRLLLNSLLKVLPPDERERAKARVAEAKELDKELDREARESKKEQQRASKEVERAIQRDERKREREKELQAERIAANQPTDKQIAFIQRLGGSLPPGSTKAQASDLIDQLLQNRPTIRQQMVLRFWSRLDLSDRGIDGISAWMDEWYQVDPDHLAAWELFKAETTRSTGLAPKSLEDVPVGSGAHYLMKVKSKSRRSEALSNASGVDTLRILFWVGLVVAFFVVLYLFIKII